MEEPDREAGLQLPFDGRSFSNSARCLIPADGFYEFTEPKVQGKKTKWLFTMTGHSWFWIAGVIRDGAFAMLTTEPGPDIAPYHDRQIVLLLPGAGVHSLNLSVPEDLILQACPAGRWPYGKSGQEPHDRGRSRQGRPLRSRSQGTPLPFLLPSGIDPAALPSLVEGRDGASFEAAQPLGRGSGN